MGATEVCMQGGIDPALTGEAYFDLVAAVKKRAPGMHVHAFSPMEIVNGAARTGLSYTDFLTKAREAGLDTIPGTAAEILDDEVRWVLTKGKLPTAAWMEVIAAAHEVGLRSSSTMMYGHVDNPSHWIGHLRVIARIQEQTGGFTEFVPLPFVHSLRPSTSPGWRGPVRLIATTSRVMRWPASFSTGLCPTFRHRGSSSARTAPGHVACGRKRPGGTLMEERISRMAGSEHGSARTVAELCEIAAGIDRPVRERTTTYGVPIRTPPEHPKRER